MSEEKIKNEIRRLEALSKDHSAKESEHLKQYLLNEEKSKEYLKEAVFHEEQSRHHLHQQMFIEDELKELYFDLEGEYSV